MALMDKAIAVGLAAVETATRRTITYTRGETDAARFEAGIGRTEFEDESDGSIVISMETIDLIVSPLSKLDFGSGKVTPQAGDKFAFQPIAGGDLVTCEVMSPDGAEQPWRYTDSARTGYRIHGKKVSEAAP